MKTKIALILTALMALSSMAQNGINYKALIKDDIGNVLANQSVQVQFSILKGIGLTNVYSESHTPTTDAFGVMAITIGEGSLISGDFPSIAWGNDDHFLNVQIDTGAGLVDMGTTEFKSVPYALHAANIGLEKLNEGDGFGWRLAGRDSNNYGVIGLGATDLSFSNTIGNAFNGATGPYAFATGYQTIASGDQSFSSGVNSKASGFNAVAIGSSNVASGLNSASIGEDNLASAQGSMSFGIDNQSTAYASTAMGNLTIASGNIATAFGRGSVASGYFSTAFGSYTKAEAMFATAMGKNNIGGGTPQAWIETDPLFEIGNTLDVDFPSNALTILKNGTITAPSFDISEITDAKALITKEYADTNYSGGGGSTGLEKIDEGNGPGWRLIGSDPNNYESIGANSVDLSQSFSAGNYGTSSGNSFASGLYVSALSSFTIAMGSYSNALAQYATTIGNYATAEGIRSTAIGSHLRASAFNSFAIGRYNAGGGDLDLWIETDPLFEVGNGSSLQAKSNALTVLKNGTITAPSFDISEITDAKALITKEYADANYSGGGGGGSSSGLEAIDEGNGIGWRLIGRDPANYEPIGENALDFSDMPFPDPGKGASGNGSVAFGLFNIASGDFSFTQGVNAEASGEMAFALGNGTIASGTGTFAMGGPGTEASGPYSTAFGFNSVASGNYATAMGYNNTAVGWNSFAAGVGNNAIGTQSMAVGGGNEASGHSAVALGNVTIASGQNSTAMGTNTIASAPYANAFGFNSVASGNGSTAFGSYTKADALEVTVIGKYNIGGGTQGAWVEDDPLFEIGNGISNASRNNALTVLKNGSILAPSFDLAEITDPKALITKEYADAISGGGNASGLEALNEGNGTGWRLTGSDPANFGNIGLYATDLSVSTSASSTDGATGLGSHATGRGTEASGNYATAMGFVTSATGSGSVALGSQSEASGINSTAMGFGSTASGYTSLALGFNVSAINDHAVALGKDTFAGGLNATAIGTNTVANGNFATATGSSTIASGIASTAMGILTTASGLYSTSMGSNTFASGPYSTAMGVGTTASGSYSTAFGSSSTALGDYATSFGQLTEANAINSTAMGNGTIADSPSSLIIGEFNDIYPDVLFQIGNGTGNGIDPGTYRANAMTVYTNGHVLAWSYDLVSDKRLKSNISNLKYGLNTILELNPVAYNWKNNPEASEKTLGLIAQEVQPIISEVVNIGSDKNETLSVSYVELIPVLINAIKEQDQIIKSQNAKIESQASATTKQNKLMEHMMQRITALELNTNQ